MALFLLAPFSPAFAGGQFSLKFGGSSDRTTIEPAETKTSSYLEVAGFVSPNDRSRFFFGIQYIQFGATWKPASDETSRLTTTNPLASVKYEIGRERNFFVGLLYTPLAQANYSRTGKSAEVWTGSVFGTQVGVRPLLFGETRVTVGLTYLSATYRNKTTTDEANSSSDVKQFTRTFWLPTLGLDFSF